MSGNTSHIRAWSVVCQYLGSHHCLLPYARRVRRVVALWYVSFWPGKQPSHADTQPW